ncbi:MAG: DUF2059 domain-containing protein [Desulfovibrio sp.]|jgi:hypothetical protein|nr:DUF2059 domain-containing protein [Desulfovibrio sp.]
MSFRAALACLCLGVCLGLAFAPAAQAQAPQTIDELTPQKQADIRRLLDISGGANTGRLMSQALTRQVIASLRQKRPDIPAQTLVVVERELSVVMKQTLDGPDGLLERMVPLYAKTFTHQEVRDLLAFYESPTGRKAAAALPGLMREGQTIGEDLAQRMLPELKRRLTEALSKEGVVLDRLPD